MKLTIYDNDLAYGGLMIDAQGFVRDRIFLSQEGSAGLSAVTKSYVDAKATSLSASSLVAGRVPAANLPIYTGDVVYTGEVSGVQNYNLKPNGVTPGWYTKYEIDTYRRVSQGSYLTDTDIPSVRFSTLSDKPTDSVGYGITDGLPLTGGTVPGPITVPEHPVVPTEVATKGYTDSVFAGAQGSSGLPIGTVILSKGWDSTKYLPCNGAVYDINTFGIYKALYDVIGQTFRDAGNLGNGMPWKSQYDFNYEQDGQLEGWTIRSSPAISTGTNRPLYVGKNAILLGRGLYGTTYSTDVQILGLDEAGVITRNIVSGAALPVGLSGGKFVAAGGYVFHIGGTTTSWTPVATVYRGTLLEATGDVTSWVTAPSLPTAEGWVNAFVAGQYLHVIGGSGAVYKSPLNGAGVLGPWSASDGGNIPQANMSQAEIAITKNRVYLMGGTSAGGTPLSSIYTAPINADGTLGYWSSAGIVLPQAMWGFQAAVVHKQLYILGGRASGNHFDTVFSAAILEDGTLGPWIPNQNLPVTCSEHSVAIVNDGIYLLGGNHGTGMASSHLYCPFKGGSRNYRELYKSSFNTDMTLNYQVPNLTGLAPPGMDYYIKYA